MGKGIIMRSGGGADLSAVTAEARDVRSGKIIVDRDGNPLTGTMPEQAAMTFNAGTSQKIIGVNGKYMMGNITIPGVPLPSADIIKKGEVYTGAGGSIVAGNYEPIKYVGVSFYTGRYQRQTFTIHELNSMPNEVIVAISMTDEEGYDCDASFYFWYSKSVTTMVSSYMNDMVFKLEAIGENPLQLELSEENTWFEIQNFELCVINH